MSSEITKLVEMTLHREVLCFLSDHSPDPDYAVEVLLLAPRPGDQEAIVDDSSSISEPTVDVDAPEYAVCMKPVRATMAPISA